MNKVVAIAAGLFLVGQSTFALAATDVAATPKAPTAHVRVASQCNVQQRKLAKAGQTRVPTTNRCNGGVVSETPKTVGLAGVAVVAAGVGIYYATKSTSP